MVEVNGTYKHGKYDKICLNSVRVMSNVKVFVKQDSWTAAEHNSLHKIYG